MSDIQAAPHTLYPPLSGNVFTTSKAGLGVPQNVSGNAGSGSVLFSWDAVAGATSYDVIVDNGTAIQLGDVQQYNAVGPNGTPILFQVIARAGGTTGGASSSISGTPSVSTGSSGASPGDDISIIRAALNNAVNGPGSVDLLVNHNERLTPGEHIFLVTRLFGSQGAVSVQFQSGGDAHDTVSGVLNWAAGDMSVRAVKVNVPSKNPGDHRVNLLLHTPTGGAKLHGDIYTKAYGIIDDDTPAGDVDAVFFDTTLAANGVGTSNSPFNNIYDAIANVGSKRYVYGKGVVNPDFARHHELPYGVGAATASIPVAGSRADEDSRWVMRNWPGVDGGSLTIDGQGANSFGFLSNGSHSHHSYRKINFQNLVNTESPQSGIWYHYGVHSNITVEYCDFTNMDGAVGSNNGGITLNGGFGGKIWGCGFSEIRTAGDNTNNNTSGVYSYTANYTSIHGCEFDSTMRHGTFLKRTFVGDRSFCCRFNIYRNCDAHYAISGGGNPGHAGISLMYNAFIGEESGFTHQSDSYGQQGANAESEIIGNIFYGCGRSAEGPNEAFGLEQHKYLENLYVNCQFVQADSRSSALDVPYMMENNLRWSTTGNTALGVRSNITSFNYVSRNVAETQAIIPGACTNDIVVDPRFTDIDNENFIPLPDSPILTGRIDGGSMLLFPEKIGIENVA